MEAVVFLPVELKSIKAAMIHSFELKGKVAKRVTSLKNVCKQSVLGGDLYIALQRY